MVIKISAKNGFMWDESYVLGNEKVDAQHRQLFDLVNSLVYFCEDGTDKEKIEDSLNFLVNYTVQHFNDEEVLQVECNFPEYKLHKNMHEDFKVTVGELVQRFNECGSTTKLGSDIKTIVVKWLVDHILTEDKKIGVDLKTCTA